MEERSTLGALTRQFFSHGETIASVSYFYAMDRLGSVNSLVDGGGNEVARYTFDSFGNTVAILESVAADFQYLHLYKHVRSGLNLPMHNFYDSALGRLLSRDFSEVNDFVAPSPGSATDLTVRFSAPTPEVREPDNDDYVPAQHTFSGRDTNN